MVYLHSFLIATLVGMLALGISTLNCLSGSVSAGICKRLFSWSVMPLGKHGVNKVVHVGFVIKLVRYKLDGFKLVGVARGYYNFVWLALAVTLNCG